MPTQDIIDLIQAAVVAIVAIALVVPIGKAIARRISAPKAAPQSLRAGEAERMERMERAIEAISVEVERIAESQRFMTKLLASGEKVPVLPGSR